MSDKGQFILCLLAVVSVFVALHVCLELSHPGTGVFLLASAAIIAIIVGYES